MASDSPVALPDLDWQVIETWGPIAFGLIIDRDRSLYVDGGALAFRLEGGAIRELPGILRCWGHQLNLQYVRLEQQTRRANLAHVDTVREWTSRTRAIAEDIQSIYGDRVASLLRATASEIEEVVAWPAVRFIDPPSDPHGVADLLFSANLWGYDQLRVVIERAIGGRQRQLPGRFRGLSAILAPAIAELTTGGLPHMTSDKAVEQRIRRLEARIKPGERENLMVDLLAPRLSGSGEIDPQESSPTRQQ